MLQPVADKSHEMFYTQLLRWLVNDTPRRMMVSTPKQMLNDESLVKLRADIRDKAFLPAADATVEAHILGPMASQRRSTCVPIRSSTASIRQTGPLQSPDRTSLK